MYQPKVVLVIMDGWGYSTLRRGNAVLQAKTPNYDQLWKYYPHTLLSASGEMAGLSWGNIGGSEVGHFLLGAGRIVYHDLPRISRAIASGDFDKNSVLIGALNFAKKNKSNLHLIGLISAGGVHSHIDHVFALLKILKQRNFKQSSYIHMFTDGRDVANRSAPLYIDKLNARVRELKLPTKIASVIGRYFAMDRDSRWDRTYQAYSCLVTGQGQKAESAKEAVLIAHQNGQTDEFIKPTVIVGPTKQGVFEDLFQKKSLQETPIGLVQNNDALIFFNFRPERMRQLMETFLFPQAKFPQKKMLKNLYIATMAEYDKSMPVFVAFPPEKINNPLAKILSEHQLSQLHIAETEKYAHITYFFDGGHPTPLKGEEWQAIPSPKVATYDLKPEMSADKVTSKILTLSKKKKYDFILINYANADMVGHSGKLQPTIKAVETIDQQLGRLVQQFPQSTFLITADHGNAENMISLHGNQINTEHSVAPVPFIIAGPEYRKTTPDPTLTSLKPTGILADIAPTVLEVFNIVQPEEMTGTSLISAII